MVIYAYVIQLCFAISWQLDNVLFRFIVVPVIKMHNNDDINTKVPKLYMYIQLLH